MKTSRLSIPPVLMPYLLLGSVALIGAGLLAWLAYRNRNLINPLSSENAAYASVSAVGGALVTEPDGPGKNADGSWSLGGWVYDVLHGDKVGMMTTGKPKF